MKLFLIRHGETVDNVAQVYAGVKDSALTIHGSLQADRLARYFFETGLLFTHIFSSDLHRAVKTATAIRHAQRKKVSSSGLPTVERLPVLREQDFGYYEGKPFYARSRNSNKFGKETHREQSLKDPNFKDVESKESMVVRMDGFLDQHIDVLLKSPPNAKESVIAIVSHGIILSTLWRCLLLRFEAKSVKLAPGLSVGHEGYTNLEHLGGWSNTGYLELDIQGSKLANTINAIDAIHSDNLLNEGKGKKSTSNTLCGWKMTVKTVNGKEHLKGLKRTGGGVGSSKHDEGQQKIETFFVSKKAKTN